MLFKKYGISLLPLTKNLFPSKDSKNYIDKYNFMAYNMVKVKNRRYVLRVNIVDSIMGSGKTAAAINFINNKSENNRFLYITPYLTEVKRICEACNIKKFKEPKDFAGKLHSLKKLLAKGENIATTHALFQLFDDEVIELCYSMDYILIMDEVANVVDPYIINAQDAKLLLKEFVTVDKETGRVQWRNNKKNYKGGKFAPEKKLCEMESLVHYGGTAFLWLFPVKIFKAFRESYILTFMFDCQLQKYYYDYNNIEYRYLGIAGNSIEDYHFVDQCESSVPKMDYKNLITIIDKRRINLIGDGRYALSKEWYKKNRNSELMRVLQKNTYNFFTNVVKIVNPKTGVYGPSCASNNLWTTFKGFEHELSGKRYANRFLSATARATNDYMESTAVAYLVNRFFNPTIRNFFVAHGIQVNDDAFATSEMLQFLWRSAIRQGKPITVYIPSSRMRSLLKKWIAENSL